jgi:hypothetical protein
VARHKDQMIAEATLREHSPRRGRGRTKLKVKASRR